MCYICTCFAWSLDLIQRIITFGIACLLSCTVCIGLALAIIVGIAYGYNYSMAEFITFTRSDVTVYMRRGQFYDKPDLGPSPSRRSGDEDLFGTNLTIDYEDQRPAAESKPLADSWHKTQDLRKYAEVLTRYSSNKSEGMEEESQVIGLRKDMPHMAPPTVVNYIRPVDLEAPVISIMPNPLIPTVTWRSDSTQIKMRKFQRMHDYTEHAKTTEIPGSLFLSRTKTAPESIPILDTKENAKEDYFRNSYMPMRVWGTTARAFPADDGPEDVDEDTIVYKPV